MTYAFVQDIASSWTHYERVAATAIDPIPDGLILHLAGPTEEGFRIIAVWESKAAWQHFHAQRLEPLIAALGGPARPQPTFRELDVAHSVVGPCSNTDEEPAAGLPTPIRADESRARAPQA